MHLDTITAIATPMGEGAIGIVRLSGTESISYANKIFKEKDLTQLETHTIHYGHLVNPLNKEIIEEVMISIMRAPRTFTREDVVEIQCHGGIRSVQRVLELVLEQGARLAEPGEFTKRAFLNGRIDLSQAEAVIDLIRAKTDQAMNVALMQLEGKLSEQVKVLRQVILETLAQVEVNIDYPEYDDVEEMTAEIFLPRAMRVKTELNKLLSNARQGKVIREGVATAIIGRPNVGKSSLLNRLIQENKAIVTNIPGTTRDVIEEFVNIQGVPLRLIDTAGIRETKDVVEAIGVERSKKAIQTADLILFVLNNNENLSNEDKELIQLIKNKEAIYVINKTDLPSNLDINELKVLIGDAPIVATSIEKEKGIYELEKSILNVVFEGKASSQDLTYVSNTRHIDLLKKANKSVDDAIEGMNQNLPIDLIQIDFTQAWEYLGEITGDQASDSLIDQLFSQFCLGK